MLEDLKMKVMNIAKKAQKDGMCKHKSGNFSARDKETGYVVITPTSVDREDLQIRDMVVMDLNANVIENLTGLRPTSECQMHLELYKKRPEICAVAHTHSMYGTVFAVLNKPIPAVVYEIATLGCTKARIPVAQYARPGTPELAKNVAETSLESDVLLMQGHGTVAVDSTSIEEAYLKVCYIEELAEIYHHALTANNGVEPYSFPVEEIQRWEYPKEVKFPKVK